MIVVNYMVRSRIVGEKNKIFIVRECKHLSHEHVSKIVRLITIRNELTMPIGRRFELLEMIKQLWSGQLGKYSPYCDLHSSCEVWIDMNLSFCCFLTFPLHNCHYHSSLFFLSHLSFFSVLQFNEIRSLCRFSSSHPTRFLQHSQHNLLDLNPSISPWPNSVFSVSSSSSSSSSPAPPHLSSSTSPDSTTPPLSLPT